MRRFPRGQDKVFIVHVTDARFKGTCGPKSEYGPYSRKADALRIAKQHAGRADYYTAEVVEYELVETRRL